MSLISEQFLVFAAVLVLAFYLAPKRLQWVLLLLASCVFYAAAGLSNCGYIVITALSAYGAGLVLEKLAARGKAKLQENKASWSKEEKKAWKARVSTRRKWVMAGCLVLNFGLLCVFKYAGFVLQQVNELSLLLGGGEIKTVWNLITPLGISFYTFQTMGYVVDVYWEKCPAQRNFPKLLLFTSFFPQVTQGPISDYQQLSQQLFAQHDFKDENITFGFQRMLWGYFKKMVIADAAAPLVQTVFASYQLLPGNNVLIGAFLYSLQIYADFSGYMDIICGLCQMLDLQLAENFERPYFSKSVAEYWRRWHITLGAWFKTYLYYPVAVSGAAKRLTKWGSRVFGARFGRTLAASFALVVVWLTTGLWHGASWSYIAWGGINGICIIAALWLEPVCNRLKARCHIKEDSFAWRAFITLRTFFLVTLIKVFPEVGSFGDGVGFWAHCFKNWDLGGVGGRMLYPVEMPRQLLLMGGGALVLFAVSLLQRKGSVRLQLCRLPRLVRLGLFVFLFFVVVWYGIPLSTETGGFLYAQF